MDSVGDDRRRPIKVEDLSSDIKYTIYQEGISGTICSTPVDTIVPLNNSDQRNNPPSRNDGSNDQTNEASEERGRVLSGNTRDCFKHYFSKWLS